MLNKYILHETSVDTYGYILPLYQKIFDLFMDTGYFDSTDSNIDSSSQTALGYVAYLKFLNLPYYMVITNAGGSRNFSFNIRTEKNTTSSILVSWTNVPVASTGLDNGTLQVSVATDDDNFYFGFLGYNGVGYNLKVGVVKFIDDTTSYILIAPESSGMSNSVKLYTNGTGNAYDYQIANTFNAKVNDADLGLYRDADITTSGDFIQLDKKILNMNYIVTGHTFSQYMPLRVNDELYIPFNNYTIYKYGVANVTT